MSLVLSFGVMLRRIINNLGKMEIFNPRKVEHYLKLINNKLSKTMHEMLQAEYEKNKCIILGKVIENNIILFEIK